MAKETPSGSVNINAANGGSISVRIITDNKNKEKVALVFHGPLMGGELQIITLEEWEADALVSAISLVNNKVKNSWMDLEPRYLIEGSGELKKAD